jgi:hypothetical protein
VYIHHCQTIQPIFNVVFRKYVFNLFNVEKDRSLLAVVTGRVVKICKSLKVEGKIDILHF